MSFGAKSKKFWIIPQACLSPDDLVLGNILKRPDDPIDSLNRHAVEAIDPLYVVNEREQVTKGFSDALESGFGSQLGASSVLAAIFGASPSLEGKWAGANSSSIEATRVRARHFLPPMSYVNTALRTPDIDAYVRKSFFTAPIYMVVGVAVASTLSRTAKASSDKTAKAGVALGPPSTGLEVSAELSAHRGSSSSYNDSVEEEVVLAYRVRRFRYSKRRKEFTKKDEDETRHASYKVGEEAEQDEDFDEGDNDVAILSYFEDRDVAADEASMGGFVEDGDDEDDSEDSQDDY